MDLSMLLGGHNVHEAGWAISVRDCRAVVSKRRDHADGSWSFVPVSNWESLEEQAIAAIEAQGGAVNQSGLYHCPECLRALAEAE